MKKVLVVTSPELGWDCVVAVYDLDNACELELEVHTKKLELDGYVLTEVAVDQKISDFYA